MGSVGKNIFIGSPCVNSLNWSETGVAKTTNNKSLSKAKIATNRKTNKKGTNKKTN